MGSSGGGGSTTQKVEPWKGQQPYLKEVFGLTQQAYNNGSLAPEYYQGTTVAPMDSATEQALNLQEQRALNGNAGLVAAQDQLQQTASGQYLADNPFLSSSGNPELDAMVQRAIAQANSGVASNFAAAGRYGSGAFHTAANDSAGNIAGQMYGQAYDQDQNRALSAWNAERNNQMQAAAMAPSLASADYQDISALSEVGTARENYAQQLINADMEKYNHNANREALALQNYMNLISGNYGMSGTSTSSGGTRGNPLGGVLAGATSGAGLGLQLAGLGTAVSPGVGSAIGAGLGGLLGLFS